MFLFLMSLFLFRWTALNVKSRNIDIHKMVDNKIKGRSSYPRTQRHAFIVPTVKL